MSDMQRETLFRSAATFELRDDEAGGMPKMVINFARFNEWTEINSIFEGHFMERFSPGAFKKTFSERADKIRVLFQHGQDPQLGKKPLGSIARLWEDDNGAWGEVDLLDTDYVRELVPGLRAGLYGASHQFKPTRDAENADPGRSDHNPAGIPEVTVKEAMLREFGPVTFPAYEGTTVAVRSLTDDLILDRLMREDPEKVRALLKSNTGLSAEEQEQPEPEASTETADTEEQAPAERATPAPESMVVGGLYLEFE